MQSCVSRQRDQCDPTPATLEQLLHRLLKKIAVIHIHLRHARQFIVVGNRGPGQHWIVHQGRALKLVAAHRENQPRNAPPAHVFNERLIRADVQMPAQAKEKREPAAIDPRERFRLRLDRAPEEIVLRRLVWEDERVMRKVRQIPRDHGAFFASADLEKSIADKLIDDALHRRQARAVLACERLTIRHAFPGAQPTRDDFVAETLHDFIGGGAHGCRVPELWWNNE